jgi:hypothetical protein
LHAHFDAGSVDLILADPPYTTEDANHYGTAMVNRQTVFAECTHVLRAGGHLVWLDMVLPMFSSDTLRTWGYIGIVRSTMHRFRIATMWERQ